MNVTTAWPGFIRDKIVQACPQYRDKLEVYSSVWQWYYEDSRDFFVRFVGVNADVEQMELLPGLTNPVTGDQLNITSSTSTPYNPSRIFYEPVPFEFLHTAETTPQVMVTVDGLPAVCASLNCGYTYVAPTALITSFSHSGTTLTINGNNLDSGIIQSIEFAHVACSNIQVSATQITCTVTPVAGQNWAPIVTDNKGIIPIAQAATKTNIPLTLSTVTPSTSLNPYGGTILTL